MILRQQPIAASVFGRGVRSYIKKAKFGNFSRRYAFHRKSLLPLGSGPKNAGRQRRIISVSKGKETRE